MISSKGSRSARNPTTQRARVPKISGVKPVEIRRTRVNAELDTLATALYVTIDDALVDHPEWVPHRPQIGIAPKLSDAELFDPCCAPSPTGLYVLKRCSSATPTHTSEPCSPTSRTGPATTNGSVTPQIQCVTSPPCCLAAASATPTTSGWLIPPPLNAAAAVKPPNVPT